MSKNCIVNVRFDSNVYSQLQDLKKELNVTYRELFTDLLEEKLNSSNRIIEGQISFDDYLKEQKLSDRVVGFEEK